MARNKIQEGRLITVIATGAITSGQGVLTGALFGVAMTDAATGEAFEKDTCGVYELPKTVADDITQGAKVYWTGSAVSKTASGNTLIGCASEAAGNGAAVVRVRLNGTV
ncbi:DUF2190 family protein [Endozoicomonas sp. ALB115]|uniref:DUF2190 family protein n=1 Tax=Endozoicomonas sp. ALB115 TaxID=3403074 RepID=UPI003BB6D106